MRSFGAQLPKKQLYEDGFLIGNAGDSKYGHRHSTSNFTSTECLISARVQPFLLVWARQETAFIHHIKEVPDLIVPFS